MAWRLIPAVAATGHCQMAVDHWLLNQCQQGLHPPVLRFYTWSPPAISLGYNQHSWPQHWRDLIWNQQPIDLVRRPTGGRAVLHQGDLTYAIVLSDLPSNRRHAYQFICEFLIQGWQALGVNLHYGEPGGSYRHKPNCFSTSTAADLVLANGTKLIGSAQAWRGKTVLQHGSIRLRPDPSLWTQVFGPDSQAPSLEVPTPPNQTLINSLIVAAQRWFQTDFEIDPLSAQEWEGIKGYSTFAVEEG